MGEKRPFLRRFRRIGRLGRIFGIRSHTTLYRNKAYKSTSVQLLDEYKLSSISSKGQCNFQRKSYVLIEFELHVDCRK